MHTLDLSHLWGDVVLFIACLLVTVPGSLQQKGGFTAPCTWTHTNGSVINLSSVGLTNGKARWPDLETVVPDSDPNTYSVNPCHGFTQSASCQDVAVCKNSSLGVSFNIGDVAEPNMFFSGVDNTVILEYTHTDGDVRHVSQIQTVCVLEEAGEDHVMSYGAQQDTQGVVVYKFMLFSRCACYDVCPNSEAPTLTPILTTDHTLHPIVTRTTSPPTGPFTINTPIPPKKSMSPGGVLCVLFVCLFSGYFIIGAVYMFFCAGARGKEIIPNIDFWMDLPNLVIEGLGFLANCCKVDNSSPSFTSTDQSTTEYDKI